MLFGVKRGRFLGSVLGADLGCIWDFAGVVRSSGRADGQGGYRGDLGSVYAGNLQGVEAEEFGGFGGG